MLQCRGLVHYQAGLLRASIREYVFIGRRAWSQRCNRVNPQTPIGER